MADGSACSLQWVVGPTPTQQIVAGRAPFLSFFVPGLFLDEPAWARMGLGIGVGMWHGVGMGPHMGLAWG
jgi:hypothetical protein